MTVKYKVEIWDYTSDLQKLETMISMLKQQPKMLVIVDYDNDDFMLLASQNPDRDMDQAQIVCAALNLPTYQKCARCSEIDNLKIKIVDNQSLTTTLNMYTGQECSTCSGAGKLELSSPEGVSLISCPACNGTGKVGA